MTDSETVVGKYSTCPSVVSDVNAWCTCVVHLVASIP